MTPPLFTADEVGVMRRRLRALFYQEGLTFTRAAKESGIDREAFSRLLAEKPVSDQQLINIHAYLTWRIEETKRFLQRLAEKPTTVIPEERVKWYIREYKRYGKKPPDYRRWRGTKRDLLAMMDRDLKTALRSLFHEAISKYKLRFSDSANYWSWKRELFRTMRRGKKIRKLPGTLKC